MNSYKFDIDEFLMVTKALTEEQYGADNDYSDFNDILNEEKELEKPRISMSSEPALESSVVDLTNTKANDIPGLVKSSPNIKVGSFLIKIKKYYGASERHKNLGNLNLKIMEEKNKIWCNVNIAKDNRFKDVPWIGYFKNEVKAGEGIKPDDLIEIIRWLQALDRVGLFF